MSAAGHTDLAGASAAGVGDDVGVADDSSHAMVLLTHDEKPNLTYGTVSGAAGDPELGLASDSLSPLMRPGESNNSLHGTAAASSGGKGRNMMEVLSGDHSDVSLISSYSGAIAFLNASASPAEGEVCSTPERISSWSLYALVVVVYLLRHFVIQRKKYSVKPMWFRVLRCLVFALFILTLNEEPLGCEVSRQNIKNVRYAQAALWSGLALFAGQVLILPKVDDAVKKRRDKKARRAQPEVIGLNDATSLTALE